MNTEALFLFLILLLGLVFCSFLGGNCGNEGFTGKNSETNATEQTHTNNKNNTNSTNGASTSSNVSYDNYNHFNGSSTQLASGTTFYGQNGGSVVVNTDSNGEQSLQVTLANGQQPMTFSSQEQSSVVTESYTNYSGNSGTYTIFYGPNSATATIVTTNNGEQAINVETSSGSYLYIPSGSNPDTTTSTQYYGSTGTPIQESSSSLAYQEPYGGSAGSVSGPQGNAVAGTTSSSSLEYQGPYGNAVAGTTTGGYGDKYYSTMPQGIPRSQIPAGQEDLYILKSQIVPPVCPACPVGAAYPRQEKCPPCPACARCPEPSFECKKVPNYSAMGSEQMPMPVLSDFSSFGM